LGSPRVLSSDALERGHYRVGTQQWFCATTALKRTATTAIQPADLADRIKISEHRNEVPIRIPGKTRRRRWLARNAPKDF
jgi:hypothetical protein